MRIGDVAPVGSTSLSPGMMRLFVVRLLALSRAGSATPTLAAMPARKSPFFTTYWFGASVVGPAASVGAARVRVLSVMAERDAASSTR